MKKPLNTITVLFSIAAVTFIIGDLFAVISILQSRGQNLSAGPLWVALWSQARPTLSSAGQLFGVGVVIELVDQLRWNSLPVELVRRKAGSSLAHSLFRRPGPS